MNAFISAKARGVVKPPEIFADDAKHGGSGQLRLQDAQLLGGSFLRLRFDLCPAFFHSS